MTTPPLPRPLSIKIASSLVTVLAVLAALSWRQPVSILGFTLAGWGSVILRIALVLTLVSTAQGLSHLKEWARKTALILCLLFMAQGIIALSLGLLDPETTSLVTEVPLLLVLLIIDLVVPASVVVLLIKRKAAFVKPTTAPPA